MEDFRLHCAIKVMEPEKAKKLPLHLQKQIVEDGPIQSVRPSIPEDIQYVGTMYKEFGICYDYYRCPDGTLRQEYRRRYQKIILSFREKPVIPGRRVYEKKGKKRHVDSFDSIDSLDDSKFFGCEPTQPDGQAVWKMEHDRPNVGDYKKIAVGAEGVDVVENERGGSFAMLPMGGET